MDIPYVTCDVFTDRAGGGNPLAVCYDAHGLTSAQMQQIATEFNYSETTFVLPPQNEHHDAQVRIFTPVSEIDFAGHPNVGTAIALAQLGLAQGRDQLVFEEKAGLVPIALEWDGGRIKSATLTAPQSPKLGTQVDVSILISALGLRVGDISIQNHAPVMASAGVYFLIIEVKDVETLGRAQCPDALEAERLSAEGVFLYAKSGEGACRARMFAPNHGIVEDPATGSAVAAFMGVKALAETQDGEWHFQIVQGVEIDRSSLLNASFKRQNGEVSHIKVGGEAVMVREGVLTI